MRGSAALATRPLDVDAPAAESLAPGEMRRLPYGGELLGAVRVRARYAALPLDAFDRAAEALEALEQAVYLHLLRLSVGEGRNWCRVAKRDLEARLRLSERRLLGTLDALVAKGFLKPLHRDNRGTLWRVYLPREAFGEKLGDEVLVGRAAGLSVVREGKSATATPTPTTTTTSTATPPATPTATPTATPPAIPIPTSTDAPPFRVSTVALFDPVDPGGVAALLVEWRPAQFRLGAGPALTGAREAAALARLDWAPFQTDRLRLLAGVDALAAFGREGFRFAGAGVGAEWALSRRLAVALEIPVVRLLSGPGGVKRTYALPGLSVSWAPWPAR